MTDEAGEVNMYCDLKIALDMARRIQGHLAAFQRLYPNETLAHHMELSRMAQRAQLLATDLDILHTTLQDQRPRNRVKLAEDLT